MYLSLFLICIAIAGCAFVPPDSYYTWYKQGDELNKVNFHKVSNNEISKLCGHNRFAIACTLMNFNTSTCDIFTIYEGKEIPANILTHELKHCAGFNHKES